MFTLVLKDGRQISTINPEDVYDFWNKEIEHREKMEKLAQKQARKSK